MEIGATSSSGYLPPALAEPRFPREAVQKPVAPEAGAAAGKDRKEQISTQPALQREIAQFQARVAVDVRDESDGVQTESASGSAPQKEIAIANGGGIKMDVEEGHRVLKVFDSKDVLIYQLPPKGALMLITAQENTQQSQVRTSA